MKKEYLEPQIKIILDMKAELLTGSDVDSGRVTGNGGGVGIDYGGRDEGGNKDPEAKQNIVFQDIWEDAPVEDNPWFKYDY